MSALEEARAWEEAAYELARRYRTPLSIRLWDEARWERVALEFGSRPVVCVAETDCLSQHDHEQGSDRSLDFQSDRDDAAHAAE